MANVGRGVMYLVLGYIKTLQTLFGDTSLSILQYTNISNFLSRNTTSSPETIFSSTKGSLLFNPRSHPQPLIMSSTTTKPTIIIVPGSFSAARIYDNLINALHALSYQAVVSDLPSASRLPPASAASMADDAEHFHGIAESLADEGRDIVIVTHSYGGIPGTEAAKGLAKTDREAEGKKGGIVRLVYLTSVVPPVGGTLISTLGELSEAITINVCVPIICHAHVLLV